ncbi:exonuclease domain-containing protein [Neobacillus sp. LXY-1]|uniref:exonuclease domain-containing protein n=1 Tax=Neobacillus sp. LXY-1 TaxID=3379133 RepID=UPI003EE220F7
MNQMIQFFKQIYAGVQGQNTPQHISYIRHLQREMQKNLYLDTPLQELKAVVFDIETTGFYPEQGDQVLSIGAVKMSGSSILSSDTFYSLIRTDQLLSPEISSLTNIREEHLQSAPEGKDVLIQFFKFVGNQILIAHHSKHEQAFMKKLTKELIKTRFEHRIIDTSFLIRLSNPSLFSLELEEVCRNCMIDIKDRHHALGDAIMTAKVWSYYLKEAEMKGFVNLRAVYEHLSKIG